jgi:hypothetical protein
MAVDKLVDSTQLDADLTSVANAIRTKGGTSADLAFPAGFVSAVQAIPTGGGGFSADDVATHGFSGDVVITSTSLLALSFAGSKITSVTAPNTTSFVSQPNYSGGSWSGRVFAGCQHLARVDLPLITTTGDLTFYGCTSLVSVHVPKAKNVSANSFQNCSSLPTIVLPGLDGIIYASAFAGCSSLQSVDIGGTNPQIARTSAFKDCSTLNILVLRKTTAVSLTNINNFDGTPFASGGNGGTLYVPSSLISSYQSATNWSTILGYANNQIKSIESTHTDPNAPIDLTLYYADGTLIPTT